MAACLFCQLSSKRVSSNRSNKLLTGTSTNDQVSSDDFGLGYIHLHFLPSAFYTSSQKSPAVVCGPQLSQPL